MDKLLTFSLLLVISIASYAQSDKEIQYRSDRAKMYDQSKVQKKNIFIYFYMNGCDACDYLDKEMNNRSIAKLYNESFLNYKHNASKEGKEISDYFGVYTFPTLLYLNENGKPLYKSKGYKEGEDIFQIGKVARKSKREIKKTMVNKYKDDPSDLDHLLEYIEYQTLHGKYKKAEKLLKAYLKERQNTEDAIWMNVVLDYAGYYDSYANDILILEKDKFIGVYGKKIIDETIMFSIQRHIQEYKHYVKASKFRNSFNEKIEKAGYDPDSPEVTSYLVSFFHNSFFQFYDIDKVLHEYEDKLLKIKQQYIPHDLMILVARHLITTSRDPAVLKNLYSRLEANFKVEPHYSLLDLQSVILYLLDDKDASITKVIEARDLAFEQGLKKFIPSINRFRRFGLID